MRPCLPGADQRRRLRHPPSGQQTRKRTGQDGREVLRIDASAKRHRDASHRKMCQGSEPVSPQLRPCRPFTVLHAFHCACSNRAEQSSLDCGLDPSDSQARVPGGPLSACRSSSAWHWDGAGRLLMVRCSANIPPPPSVDCKRRRPIFGKSDVSPVGPGSVSKCNLTRLRCPRCRAPIYLMSAAVAGVRINTP